MRRRLVSWGFDRLGSGRRGLLCFIGHLDLHIRVRVRARVRARIRIRIIPAGRAHPIIIIIRNRLLLYPIEAATCAGIFFGGDEKAFFFF